jgi:lipid-A-disaccharide synthase
MLRRAGAEVVVENRQISVMGVVEVIRQAPSIYAGYRRLRDHLAAEHPDVVVLVDFPDFNLLLARAARKLGIRVFYYISPQVWAWRSGRVRTIRRIVDRMAVIFPFEVDFYARRGMTVHFVGHPLVDALLDAPEREESRAKYGADDAPGPLVGLLPGSRHGEIRRILPPFLDAAERLSRSVPGIRFLLPVAPTLDRSLIETALAGRGLPVSVAEGDTYGVIRACDLLLTASGTVTLEAALLGTPMIIAYRMSRIEGVLARSLVRVSHIGLPNLVAGRGIVPELVLEEATGDRLAAEALAHLRAPEKLAAQRAELDAVRLSLGEPGCSERAARLVLDIL